MAGPVTGLRERAQRTEQKGNRDVRDLWERYRGHRERVTAEILALAPGGRLCLLGAGNANDLDLEALAARFDEIHLVDIDPAALSRAVGRQPASVRGRLHSHPSVDLSGLYRQLERPRIPAPDELVETGAAEVLAALPRDFDVAASLCVLSQMAWALEELLPTDETVLPALQQSLLRIHLRTMLALVRPGAAALLVADLVSSRDHALDELGPDEDLAALADRLTLERAVYPVCNPDFIRLMIRRDSELAAGCEPPRRGQPWLWAGPREHTYLVCPLVLRRRP